MSYVAFVPGLEGDLSLQNRTLTPLSGTYAYAAFTAAQNLGLPFYRIDFQTATVPNPILSDMGQSVAEQIVNLHQDSQPAGLIVASSIGAGVALQSLKHIAASGTPMPSLLLFKPALDPLAMIEIRMKQKGAEQYVTMLREGKLSSLPIEVDASHYNPNPGKFMLTPAHINDANALRILTSPASQAELHQSLLSHPLPEMSLVTAQSDAMCPAHLAYAFSKIVNGGTRQGMRIVLLPGDRADDHSSELSDEIMLWAKRQPN